MRERAPRSAPRAGTPRAAPARAASAGRKHLDRDRAREPHLAREIDHAHAAAAELAVERVLAGESGLEGDEVGVERGSRHGDAVASRAPVREWDGRRSAQGECRSSARTSTRISRLHARVRRTRALDFSMADPSPHLLPQGLRPQGRRPGRAVRRLQRAHRRRCCASTTTRSTVGRRHDPPARASSASATAWSARWSTRTRRGASSRTGGSCSSARSSTIRT